MPHIDPVARFWIGIAVTVAIAISGGTLNLTHVVPTEWIPIVSAWCAIIAFIGSAILTTLNGMATTNGSRLASVVSVPLDQKLDAIAESDPRVKSIVTTQALAEATNSEKVVGPPAATGSKT